MKILLTKVFTDPIEKLEISIDPRDPASQKITLKTVVATALRFGAQNQQEQISGDEHAKRWKLMNKIADSGDEVEFSSEETVLLKRLIEKAWASSVIVGQAQDILEGK